MNRKQTIPKNLRYTRTQFDADYPNDDVCLETIKEQRFPGSVAHCEKCDLDRKHYRVRGRTAYACDRCGNHIYPLAGTIFEKSTTSLRTWFQAMYLMGSTRCGISAKQIQRETGVTYKTAWRMFKQIRTLLAEDFTLEGSSVEMDETYMGGRRKGRSGRPGLLDRDGPKSCVVRMVERKGRVIARIAEDASKKTLHDLAHEKIMPKSMIFTDEHPPTQAWTRPTRIGASITVLVCTCRAMFTPTQSKVFGCWLKKASAVSTILSARSICKPT